MVTKRIPLTKGKFALCDDADYEYLMQWHWQFHQKHFKGYTYTDGYARRAMQRSELNGKPFRCTYMHTQLLGKKKGFEIDHIDGDGCNNQRSNLRFVTHSQNCHNKRKRKDNTSGYVGVRFDKNTKLKEKWLAILTVDHKTIKIGRYRTRREAAKAYDAASRERLGEHALRTNFKS